MGRLSTFPKYLAIQMGRYYVDESWLTQKREVRVPVPQQLDLTHLRAKGMSGDEEPMAEVKKEEKVAMEADAQIVSTLVMLGLAQTENAAKRAALAVQNANADMAAAWIMEHANDADINEPIKKEGGDGDGDGDADKDSVDE